MVLGWRRAFCTSIPKTDPEQDSPIIKDKPDPSPRLRSRFTGFFSDPSTPTLRCRTTATAVSSNKPPQESPKLQCKTRNSPRFFLRSAPSSPRSPSAFSLLKSTLRLSKSRCGICMQSAKTGQGTAIFTAECGHSFHFPCIVKKQGTCPVCRKEMHQEEENRVQTRTAAALKVYNDDEPPTSGARFFNPIPESDEENEEFPGFFANAVSTEVIKRRTIEAALLSEAAVVSVGKATETYAVVLKLKAPPATLRRPPIDLVTVLEVSITADKLQLMRKAMRTVVSSLSAADRLSIVAFSTTSKRLLPLRRMTTAGRRSARRIIDAVASLDGPAGASATDSLKKAAKVIEDRREKNPAAAILLFSDGHRGGDGPLVSSTRFSQPEIPVHTVSLGAWIHAPPEDSFARCVTGLLGKVAQDLKIQLGFATGSAPAEISAVYSYTGKPAFVGSGSSWCRVGDLHSEEERELLIELKVPSSLGGAHPRLLTVRSSYKDPPTGQTIYDKERSLPVPRPRAVGTSTRDIQRLRCLFVTTRAVAESKRMVERGDVAGAHHMLASARALVLQSGSGEEFVRGLEAELAELNWRRRDDRVHMRSRGLELERGGGRLLEEKAEPLTPTSAWRAAERLAKVAIMRKSLNRVSDLHGFENARF